MYVSNYGRRLALDHNGMPMLLDGGVEVPTKSGNPTHVPAGKPGGGRFGGRDATLAAKTVTTRGTAGASQEEVDRRLDAVREAAREFEVFTPQDIEEWLRGRINRPFSKADVDAFFADVRAQQLTDLIDVIDQNERGIKRGRRRVRIMAPKGYRRKLIGALTSQELQQVVVRLRARGWSDGQLKTFSKKLPVPPEDPTAVLTSEYAIESPRSNDAPQPIYLQVPESKPRSRIIHRDKRGLITRVEER